MKIIVWILKIPIYLLKWIGHFILFILKCLFGFLFGWIPDFDERMSGEEFEQYVQEILKRNGYKHVELTKRSGDYGVDILAQYKGEYYAFQCKKYAKPVGVAAVQQAYSGCQYYECDQAVVVTNHRFTAQAIALAQTNDVILWDGEKLDQLKRKANRRSLIHKSYDEKEIVDNDFYEEVIGFLLDSGYASTKLLMDHFGYSEEKSFAILEDFAFHDLVSEEDDLGIREIYFLTVEEVIELYNKIRK